MAKSLLLAWLLSAGFSPGWSALPAAPSAAPDGRLVLGIHGGGEFAAVADPRSGAIRTRRLAGGTLCHGPVLALGDRVVFGGYRGRQAVVRTLPLSLDGSPELLGRAETFTPSAVPGRLWLGHWPGPTQRRWTNSPVEVVLREVDGEGRISANEGMLLPRFTQLHVALDDRFVATEGRWLTVRAPGRSRPLLRIRDGWFAGAHGSRFAWCPGGGCRTLRVRSPQGEHRVALPAGTRWLGSEGVFSPDGLKLALPIVADGDSRLAVVDLRTRSWALAPGQPGGYPTAAWSPSGRWLYFTAGERKLRAWQPGAPSALTLPIRPRGTILSIAAAP
jgi:WD40-like Beta Propeller Repeat